MLKYGNLGLANNPKCDREKRRTLPRKEINIHLSIWVWTVLSKNFFFRPLIVRKYWYFWHQKRWVTLFFYHVFADMQFLLLIFCHCVQIIIFFYDMLWYEKKISFPKPCSRTDNSDVPKSRVWIWVLCEM